MKFFTNYRPRQSNVEEIKEKFQNKKKEEIPSKLLHVVGVLPGLCAYNEESRYVNMFNPFTILFLSDDNDSDSSDSDSLEILPFLKRIDRPQVQHE